MYCFKKTTNGVENVPNSVWPNICAFVDVNISWCSNQFFSTAKESVGHNEINYMHMKLQVYIFLILYLYVKNSQFTSDGLYYI